MNKNEYTNLLISAFNKCKETIKEGKREIIIDKDSHKKTEFVIPSFENFEDITIYSISKDEYLYNKYIHLSGVNVLYYICCLYLRLLNNTQGKYYEYTSTEERKRMIERIKVLKNYSFIFNENEKGFWYYPINEIKNTNKLIFDLPSIIDHPLIEGRK